MSKLSTVLTVTTVLALHGAAWAALSAPRAPVTPPALKSAPPIFGQLVSSPQVVPEKVTRPNPPKQKQDRTLPAQEPVEKIVQEPEPVTEENIQPVSPQTDVATVTEPQEVTEPVVVPPRVDASARANPPPAYPSASRRAKEQGTVVLAIHINEKGRVTSARVQQSSGFPRLDRAALEAVRHWRYQPATQQGRAMGYDYLQPVVFSLESNSKKE